MRRPAPRRGYDCIHQSVGSRVVLNVPTDLQNIVGLAYSPTAGNLYAANAGAEAPSKDGIYRLDDAGKLGHPAIKATKVADVITPPHLHLVPMERFT